MENRLWVLLRVLGWAILCPLLTKLQKANMSHSALLLRELSCEGENKAPSTRIRFRTVFIETANFSMRFHIASATKPSKTMIVYTENENF